MAGTRDKTKELSIPNGIYSANALPNLDPLFGIFDDQADAFASVLPSERKIGKMLGIYEDASKSSARLYMWSKTVDLSTWSLTQVGGIFATQAEAEDQTEPIIETNKSISTFSIWKWWNKIRYLVLMPVNRSLQPAIAHRIRKDATDGRLYVANTSAVEKGVAFVSDLPTTFDYTITANFTTTQLKTAVENAGLIFRGIHINVIIGSNNLVCNIDNGLAIGGIWSMERTGTGSVTFTTPSGRALDGGIFNILTLSGNESSTCVFQHKTAKDYVTIRNK